MTRFVIIKDCPCSISGGEKCEVYSDLYLFQTFHDVHGWILEAMFAQELANEALKIYETSGALLTGVQKRELCRAFEERIKGSSRKEVYAGVDEFLSTMGYKTKGGFGKGHSYGAVLKAKGRGKVVSRSRPGVGKASTGASDSTRRRGGSESEGGEAPVPGRAGDLTMSLAGEQEQLEVDKRVRKRPEGFSRTGKGTISQKTAEAVEKPPDGETSPPSLSPIPGTKRARTFHSCARSSRPRRDSSLDEDSENDIVPRLPVKKSDKTARKESGDDRKEGPPSEASEDESDSDDDLWSDEEASPVYKVAHPLPTFTGLPEIPADNRDPVTGGVKLSGDTAEEVKTAAECWTVSVEVSERPAAQAESSCTATDNGRPIDVVDHATSNSTCGTSSAVSGMVPEHGATPGASASSSSCSSAKSVHHVGGTSVVSVKEREPPTAEETWAAYEWRMSRPLKVLGKPSKLKCTVRCALSSDLRMGRSPATGKWFPDSSIDFFDKLRESSRLNEAALQFLLKVANDLNIPQMDLDILNDRAVEIEQSLCAYIDEKEGARGDRFLQNKLDSWFLHLDAAVKRAPFAMEIAGLLELRHQRDSRNRSIELFEELQWCWDQLWTIPERPKSVNSDKWKEQKKLRKAAFKRIKGICLDVGGVAAAEDEQPLYRGNCYIRPILFIISL